MGTLQLHLTAVTQTSVRIANSLSRLAADCPSPVASSLPRGRQRLPSKMFTGYPQSLAHSTAKVRHSETDVEGMALANAVALNVILHSQRNKTAILLLGKPEIEN